MRKLLVGVGIGIVVGGLGTGLMVEAPATWDEPTVSAAPVMQAPALGPAQALPDLTQVAERAVEAAANISSSQVVRMRNRDPFFEFFNPGRDRYDYSRRQSLGSGVIVSPDGYVLTNNHVIGDASEITVTLPGDREMRAELIGVDRMTDLAVVKVDATGLRPLAWGDSEQLRMAEWVLAIGNPFALNHSVTLGIVSAIGRTSPDLSVYTDFIQTDAAINPGNSGGALVNVRGELVGINSAIYSETGGYQGVGFAIPANLARRIMDELIENGEVRWGSIAGVMFRDVTRGLAQQVGYGSTDGVIVYELDTRSAAYRAGLRLGDVVTSMNDQRVDELPAFARLLADSAIGSMATLGIVRGTTPMTLQVPIVSTSSSR